MFHKLQMNKHNKFHLKDSILIHIAHKLKDLIKDMWNSLKLYILYNHLLMEYILQYILCIELNLYIQYRIHFHKFFSMSHY